jgi:Ca2+-transporting ATPase
MVLHHKPVEDVLNHFETDVTSGLNDGQVATKRMKYGKNKLREKKKKTTMQRFLDQFNRYGQEFPHFSLRQVVG